MSTTGFWGTKNVGINYGLLFTAWGVAGLLGGRIGGRSYDKYHSCQTGSIRPQCWPWLR